MHHQVGGRSVPQGPDLVEGDLTDYLEFDKYIREYKWNDAPRAVFTRMMEMEMREVKSETKLSTSEFRLLLGKSSFLRSGAIYLHTLLFTENAERR